MTVYGEEWIQTIPVRSEIRTTRANHCWLLCHIHIPSIIGSEGRETRERERERNREREKAKERDLYRQTETCRQTERHIQTDRQREGGKKRERREEECKRKM